MPSLKAFSFVLLWLVAGQGCLRAAGELEPTLAFRLLADDPSTFDLLNEPEWHPRLSKALLGDEYVTFKAGDAKEPTCDWCLEELMVSSKKREGEKGRGRAAAALHGAVYACSWRRAATPTLP
jgi:hypothetical protein